MTSPTLKQFLSVAIGLSALAGLSACHNHSVAASRSGASEGVREAALGEVSSPPPEIGSSDLQIGEEPQPGKNLLANNPEEKLSISPNSMGPARLGKTLGELRQTGLTIGELQPWISDFDAIPVSDGDEVLFFVVYGSWETVDDSAPIGHLVTENPRMVTPEGIGPGSAITQAETVYGQATLGYNIENHSREFVQFEDSIWSDYTFEPTTPNAPESYAGLYDESAGDTYFETSTYHDDAVIGSIAIDTRGE